MWKVGADDGPSAGACWYLSLPLPKEALLPRKLVWIVDGRVHNSQWELLRRAELELVYG